METKKERKAKNRKKMVKATIKAQQKNGISKDKT